MDNDAIIEIPNEQPAKKPMTTGRAYAHFTALYSAFIAILAVTTVFQAVAMIAIKYYAPEFYASNISGWIVSLAPLYLIGYPVAVIIMLFIERDKTSFVKTKIKFSSWMKYLCIAFMFMYIGNIIGNIVNTIAGSAIGTEASDVLGDMFGELPLWLTSALTVIAAPVIEELIFRKLFLDRAASYGEYTAIVVSALVFGLFHGNFSQFFYTYLLGLLFGYIYVKTKNIFYTITLHMAVNLFGGAVPTFLSGKLTDVTDALKKLSETGDVSEYFKTVAVNLPALAASAIFSLLIFTAFVCGIVFFFKERKKVSLKKCEYDISEKSVNIAVYANACFIVLCIICAASFVQTLLGMV